MTTQSTLTKSIIANRKRFNAPTTASAIKSDLTWHEHPGQSIISINDPRYPALLREIYAPPDVLYVQGNVTHLTGMQLAMVGSRNPSPTGIELAEHFAAELVKAGLAITSGLALGIDGASHRGALDASGITIAVLGHGLNTIYPKQHQKLATRIAQQGALVSEFPLETPIRPMHFPRRNRIISGLGLGTLVVEAALKSGSLITARLACEQGREVFALPGSLYNPHAKGCHALIRQGAILVETVDDILDEIQLTPSLFNKPHEPKKRAPSQKEKQPAQTPSKARDDTNLKLDQEQEQLLHYVNFETTPADQIIYRSKFSAQNTRSILLNLELHGYIKAIPGGYRRVK